MPISCPHLPPLAATAAHKCRERMVFDHPNLLLYLVENMENSTRSKIAAPNRYGDSTRRRAKLLAARSSGFSPNGVRSFFGLTPLCVDVLIHFNADCV